MCVRERMREVGGGRRRKRSIKVNLASSDLNDEVAVISCMPVDYVGMQTGCVLNYTLYNFYNNL